MRMERTDIEYKEEYQIIREPIEFTLNSSREERPKEKNEFHDGIPI